MKRQNHSARKDLQRSSSSSVSLWEHYKTMPLLKDENLLFLDFRGEGKNPTSSKKSFQRQYLES